MKKFFDTVVNANTGRAVEGATVTFLDSDGNPVVTYADDAFAGAATTTTTDENGLYQRYVPNGTYTIRQTFGNVSIDIPGVEIFDDSIQEDTITRALLVPEGETGVILPEIATRAGKFLVFDATGNPAISDGSGADAALRTDLATTGGASLVGTADGVPVQSAIFRKGNQTTTDKMVVDWQFGQSSYLPENIGGAWEAQTYSHLLIYKEIDTDTVDGDANPTIGGGPVANFTTLTDNTGAEGDVVGNLNVVVARANGSYTSFCRNDVLMGDTGVNQKVVLHEWDLQLASGNVGGAGSAGLIINAFNNAYNAPVFLIGGYNGGTWQDGLVFSNIRGAMLSVNSSDATTATSFIDTQNGEFSAAAIKLGKGASQGIAFGAGAFGTSPYLYCATGSNDLFMTLGASGVLKINASDGSESFWVNANNPMWRIKPLLFSQLPAAGTIGRRAYVTDSSTATYGATVSGGGANKVPVHDNGTNWVVG